MSLKFIGLPPRKVTAITNFLKTLPTKENVDLEQHPKILRKCGEKFLHRRSCLFNQLVLWLAYYRELRYHIPDLSSLLDEFEVNANAVTRRAHMYPFRDPVKARPHLRTLEATVFGDDSRTDVTVIQNAMVGATALAKLSECQPLGTGEIEFIQLRQKDVMALEDSLLAISNNMFEIRPVKLHLERHSNSSLVNATNKLIYLGKVIVHVRTSWDMLAEKCLIKIKELCKTLMKELRSCRSFESNYCSNIIKHKVTDGESADMLLEMLMEDFAIYEDIFPQSVSQTLGDPFSLEYDDEELHREWKKWLRGGWEGRPTKDDDDDKQLFTTKKQERKVPDKSERQYAFSLLSPTKQTSQLWDTKPKTPHPVSKRVTFWSDDENQGRAKDETDDVKVDTLVDFDGGLGSLKLDDNDKPSTSTYKFELPKFIQRPILNSPFATQFSNPLFATGSSETIPGLGTPLKEVSDLDMSDRERKTPPGSDYSDPESSFSPNKRREVKSEAEISDSEYEDIASGNGDEEEASDAESVVSVASIPPVTPVPPVSDSKAKRRLILKPKTKIIPKPKPSLGPFTSVTSPSTSVLKPTKRVIKATPITFDGNVIKPANFSAPGSGKDVTIVKVPTTTPTQTFTPGLTTATSTKAQTASSTEVPGGRAQKMKAEPLTSPRHTPKPAEEAKLKDLLDDPPTSTPVPDNIQAIIEKIKEDSKQNEE
ncbi:Rh55 [macacine betaherpesvirus 3]|nr:Rh55 [macacine betaherpesvirus 3]